MIVVKKYSNRKMYDTKNSEYVNLSDIVQLLNENKELKVIDNVTKEDITNLTLKNALHYVTINTEELVSLLTVNTRSK